MIGGQKVHERSKVQQYDRDEHTDNRTVCEYLGYEIVIVVNPFLLGILKFPLHHVPLYHVNYELQQITATYQPHYWECHGVSYRFHEVHHHQLQITENVAKVGIRHNEIKREVRDVNREADVRPLERPYASDGEDPF